MDTATARALVSSWPQSAVPSSYLSLFADERAGFDSPAAYDGGTETTDHVTDPEPNDDFERRRLDHMAACGFEARSMRIPSQSGDTYVMEGGQGSPPRLLIHGGLADGSVWAPLAGLLEGRVIVADRPGHGLSYRIDYRRVDSFRSAAADWVLSVADGLHEPQIDLVANSMGGYFAIAFAAAHPHRVRRLALIGFPAGLEIEAPLWFRLWGNPITGQVIRRMRMKNVDQYRAAVLPANVAHPDRVAMAQSEIEFAAGHQPNFDLAAHTMFRALTTLRGWRSDQLLEDAIRTIKAPTLFAWGELDSFAPPARGEAVAADMSDARVATIPDAGHVPWSDQPGLVATAVNDFLRH